MRNMRYYYNPWMGKMQPDVQRHNNQSDFRLVAALSDIVLLRTYG